MGNDFFTVGKETLNLFCMFDIGFDAASASVNAR
jgi:hypothetical protein